ncbi:MAG: penicillin-binding protein 2 [Oscillospiraceae bacterium]|nr:penicillin-binding protein 2 [Oscillospiraceae bacterium]
MKIFQKLIGAVSSRYTMLGLLLIVMAFAMFVRLFDLQIIKGGQFTQASQPITDTRRITEVAPRGRILDRNGVPIATNSEIFTVHIIRSGRYGGEQGEEELNRVLIGLCEILEKNNDSYLKTIERYMRFENGLPVFVRADLADTLAWQKNTLRIPEADLIEDAYTLFVYFCTERFYSIDDAYTDEEAFKIISMRYLIDAGRGAFDAGQSILLARGVGPMSIAEIEENSHILSGVTIDAEPVRAYHEAEYISHVLGYTNAITESQYEALKDDGYGVDDIIGQVGIEAQNEAYLRGRNGVKRIEVYANGTAASSIDGRPAIPGSDIILTIDMDLQKAAIESLERNIEVIRTAEFNGYVKTDSKVNFLDAEAGSAVAVDVKTGEVLLMANVPTYDASIFLRGPEDREAQQAITDLWDDPLNRSWNRAIQGTYSPGSTFKPITAITALQEGVITPHTDIYDAGRITIGERNLFCLEGGHGALSLKRALETSCNVFFYDIGEKSTIDNLKKWANLFGLGVKTGVDLPYERDGIMSSREFKYERFRDDWRPADTAQVAIGQLYNSFTPLQMACYMAAFANGGMYYKPYVTQKVIRYDGSIVRETAPDVRRIPVDPLNIEAVKDGMIASTTEIDGTAAIVFHDFPFQVAGKTGTAETGLESMQNSSSNALFVCYAPADDPQIAVVVVIEKGVWGSYAAPVARDILEVYFGMRGQPREYDALGGTHSVIAP